MKTTQYRPKTGARCHCKPGVHRDNCPDCEGTGWRIDFRAIRERSATQQALKHTPGPWKVTKGTNTFCDTWQVTHESPTRAQTIADCGAIINQVYQGSTDYFVGCQPNENHEANAQLIAAAPELLEAAQNARNVLAGLIAGDLREIKADSPALLALRAAIAKAEGK